LKKYSLELVLIVVGFFLLFTAHSLLSECETLSFNCFFFEEYVFLAVFSFFVVLTFTFLSKKEKLKSQLGFIYLGVLAFKLILFAFIFKEGLFQESIGTSFQKAHFLPPVFWGLICEVFVLKKILDGLEWKS